MSVAFTAPSKKNISSTAALPSPWKEYTDDETGKNYYYNEDTQVSTWSRPVIVKISTGRNLGGYQDTG